MLDFYLIPDKRHQPTYPGQVDLEFAGELDYKTFANLQAIEIIENHYSYHSDFRWDSHMVKQIFHKINQDRRQHNPDVQKLLELLDKVKDDDMGLIAYCD